MDVDVPVQIVTCGFGYGSGGVREVSGYVVFEAVFADVAQEFLHVGYTDYAGSSEGGQRVVGKFSFAYIAADDSFAVISRESGKGHSSGFH
jgi:hypothetical protein